jgi:hypothetical protein
VVPKFELAGGYSYINFAPGGGIPDFQNHGGNGGFTYNVNRALGLVAEVGGYGFSRRVNGNKLDGSMNTYLFGPRLNMRRWIILFHLLNSFWWGARRRSDWRIKPGAFALAAGGGIDVISQRISHGVSRRLTTL